MLTLSLFRHAKSDHGNPRQADFERPLNDRGRAAAPLMGAYITREDLMPDLVLCSSATRTKETADLAFGPAGSKRLPATHYEDVLYLASAKSLLSRIKIVPPTTRHLMLIGHNPGLQTLATELSGNGEASAIAALHNKLPTATLVVITFKAEHWSDVRIGSGRILRFVTPRSLLASAVANGEK